MSTPHINAEPGDFARSVLMPGDPLRAKFIADTFLEDAKLVTSVRNVLGFTGTYNGKRVSVMASGMGIPSMGIYSYELFKVYGVENIIRIGTTGSYIPELKLFDTILATGAYSESTYAKTQSGETRDTLYPSEELNAVIREKAAALNIPLNAGILGTAVGLAAGTWTLLAAAIATLGLDCRILLTKKDGTEVELLSRGVGRKAAAVGAKILNDVAEGKKEAGKGGSAEEENGDE